MTVLLIIIVMGIVGLIFGFILAVANKKLAVEMNPLIHIVEDALPKGQCGACGFAGCQAYAEAVVMLPDVPPNLCSPGKTKVAQRISELTGKTAKAIEPRVAHVRCEHPVSIAKMKYVYSGISDCVAASILHLGPRDCQYGCIGFGTCERVCPFNAITMSDGGQPRINRELCTGCARCENVCPKKIIEMIPLHSHVEINCNSRNKGAIDRKHCPVACIGCGICSRDCPHQAIKIENNLAFVDSKICNAMCNNSVCLAKCPTGAIAGRLKKRA
jgi:Na+-translocating ferredoxin:NAD+ oxidoreductase subunit B